MTNHQDNEDRSRYTVLYHEFDEEIKVEIMQCFIRYYGTCITRGCTAWGVGRQLISEAELIKILGPTISGTCNIAKRHLLNRHDIGDAFCLDTSPI